MTIPINDWYTLKSGDTLSKIAKEACVSDWKIIYNDSNNDAFRKKRPDPNLIYPGDKIWIPGTLKTTTGKKTVFVAPVTAEKIQVTEVYFHSQVEIHYVRLISSHVDYKATGIPIVPGYLHLNPPTIYSQAGKAHWSLDVTTSMPSESWPVVLIRDGANSAGTAVRGLKVSFSALTSFDGDRIIKAETSSGDLIVGEQTVNFQ